MRKLDLGSLDWLLLVLLIVGGLNWGLVGLFDYNLVADLFGADSALSNIVYILVGLSALYYLLRPMLGGDDRRVTAE